MAEKKALFRIEINGIVESVNAVKDLNAQLKELKGQVKDLEKTKVKVAVDVNPQQKTAVQGNDSSQQADRNNALAKLQEQLARAQAKAQAQVTEEYQNQYQELVRVNEQSKEAERTQKQIAQGVRDTNGEYANTLSGLRAYLSDLQKTFNQQEIGTDAWKETQSELTRVRELVKGIEQSTGDFRRNVGNYPNAAKDLADMFASTKQEIADTSSELEVLKRKLANMQEGTQEFDEVNGQIDELTKSLNEARQKADDLHMKLGEKLEINIGGGVEYFDDINQASKTLEKRLRQLAYEGKVNTDEFQNTIRVLGELRTAMNNVTGEVDSYIGNSKGLRDTVEIMQGMTSLASIGTGISGLFGAQNEELDKSLKKFTQLTLIMNGLSEIQQKINDKTSIWGNTLGKVWNSLQSITGKATMFSSVEQMEQNVRVVVDYDQAKAQMEKLTEELLPMFDGLSETVSTAMGGVMEQSISSMSQAAQGGADNVREALQDMVDATQQAAAQMEQRMQQLSLSPDVDQSEMDQLQQSLSQINNDYANMQQTLNDFTEGIIDEGEAVGRLREQFSGLVESMAGGGEGARELAENISDLAEEQGNLSGQAATANSSMGGFSKALASMGPMGKVAATGVKMLTGAIRGLMSATIILAVVQALVMAIEWLIDGLSKLSGSESAKAVENFDGLAASIQNTKDRMEEFNAQLDAMQARGEISSTEANRRKLEELEKQAARTAQEMKEYIATLENVKPIELGDDKDWEDAWFATRHIKDMDEFEKRYKQLVQAVSQGVDESKVVTGSGSVFLTASDAATNLAQMQQAALGELEDKINNLDFSKGEQSYQQFMELINTPLYSSALSNIEDLFPEDKWQQALRQRIDSYRDFVEQIRNLNNQLVVDQNKIVDWQNGAISDSYQRGVAERKTQMQRDLDEVKGNAEAEAAVRAYYNRLEKDARKAHNKQVNSEAKAARQRKLQIENDAMLAEINIMAEGLQKQREMLKLQQKQALDAARENGASKQTLLKITQYYNQQILDLEADFNRQVFLANRDRQNAISDEFWQFTEQIQEATNEARRSMLEYEKMQAVMQRRTIEENSMGITKRKILNADSPVGEFNAFQEAYMKMAALQSSANQQRHDELVKAEELDYEILEQGLEKERRARERYYSDWLVQQNDATEARHKQGLISDEEYNSQLAENQRIANEHMAAENQSFIDQSLVLEQNHKVRLLEIENEYFDEIQRSSAEWYTKRREALVQFYDSIQRQSERRSKQNRNGLGIINFKAEKANLKETERLYKSLIKSIDEEYKELQNQFDNNQISFDDFTKAKQELDGLKQHAQDSVKSVQTSLKNLIVDTVKSVTDVAQQYVQAFSEIWSMISNLKDVELDEQERRLEREQELLDEELEMIEKQYEKQQEITQKHADKINDIEGELATARGDRRDFLLDQLARERDSELKSLETENQIQQEKQKNEKKQEQLEKQKEQLDKKRWEQNKKNQVVQATINTFTAVTNALAVQPWFVGLALSAVALALGMANVAKIQAQKYYADGGLLTGKPHSQGGIPVGSTGIEVEGGEYVINKRTTKYNQSLLDYVNSKRRPLTRDDMVSFYDNGQTSLVSRSLKAKYADGGNLPKMDTAAVEDLINNNSQQSDNREVVVSVVDIINRMDNIQRVKVLAGLGD